MTEQSRAQNWFLVQCKPNSCAIAERNLNRQGFPTFLPLLDETRRIRDRFRTQTRPLFPGYLFVGFEIARAGWHKVNSTFGVSRLVSFGATPTPVPAALVTQLRQQCDTYGKLRPREAFKAGDKVVFSSGPFTNFLATIEMIAPDQRVCALLDLMGQTTRVSVPADQLRRADAPAT